MRKFNRITSEKGFLLLGLLVSSAIISLIIVSSYYALQDLVTLYQEASHSYLAQESSEQNLLLSLEAFTQSENPSTLDCKSQTSIRGKIETTSELCFLNHQTHKENLRSRLIIGQITPSIFPRIDFNSIFKEPSPCPTFRAHSYSHSSSGFSLLPTSAKSTQICSNPTLQGLDWFATRTNLESGQPAVIHNQNGNRPFLLAAAGYIDFADRLLVQNEAFLIAGGDIHIAELVAENQADLHLFSGTGRVQVDRLVGQPRVQVFSWELPSVPLSGATLHEFSAAFLTPIEVLSFSLTSAK